MKKINWLNIRLFLMFMLVIGLYSFTSVRNNERKIKQIKVNIIDHNIPFLKEETVNKLLIEKKADLKTVRKEDLDLNKLEKSVNSHQLIQQADIFVSVDGVLKATVKQKIPLGRVLSDSESFYLDSEGNRMPVSENFTARVPIISGEINGVKKEKLAEVLKKIQQDDFLKKNIIGIKILSNGSLIMLNRSYDFEIDFGRVIHVEKKFKNYKAFFQKAVSDSLLEKYKKINLKFTQQVVCTK